MAVEDGAGAEQRRTQLGLGRDSRMRFAGPHGKADIGSRQVDAAVRSEAPLAHDFVEPLARQYDDIGFLARAQAAHSEPQATTRSRGTVRPASSVRSSTGSVGGRRSLNGC